jgi:hypothetical protein
VHFRRASLAESRLKAELKTVEQCQN